MARARNIKPSLFVNELLGDADPFMILTFIGLWTLADREGKLENKPKKIAAQLFPYRQVSDMPDTLLGLSDLGFLDIYEVAEQSYIQVVNFKKHQNPHQKEKAKGYPDKPVDQPIEKSPEKTGQAQKSTVPTQLNPDPLIADSGNLKEEGPALPDNAVASQPAVTVSVSKPSVKKLDWDTEQKIIELYHEMLPELSAVVVSRWKGSKNSKALQARWSEGERFRNSGFWLDFFETVRTNPWWMGEKSSSGESFDGCKLAWLVNRNNFDKVLEHGEFKDE